MNCHSLLAFGRLQHAGQLFGQIFRIADAIELNGHIFFLRHVDELRKVRRNDGYPICAGQMGHSAGARGR